MVLGLSHSLSRYKLKFSPDKVDTMIVQAITLLDDLDKELNIYAMRVKEWYGWHFPELSKIVTDSLAFAKLVKAMGFRHKAQESDLSSILPEELEQEVKEAANISMGTEISEEDLANICHLCDQVINIFDYRAQLYDYLKNRMNAIAPNLTTMVGELVGARLIAHAGSLLNLAKHPASTVQILGAEKALFRALKTKHDTPKYGLIYHASLVGQAPPKLKGKISRVLAAKAALSTRVDALGGDQDAPPHIGLEARAKVEARLRQLEVRVVHPLSSRKLKQGTPKYESKPAAPKYNDQTDFVFGSVQEEKKIVEPTEQKKIVEPTEQKKMVEPTERTSLNGNSSEKKKKKARYYDEAEDSPSQKKHKKKL
jgi:nucleolar protein 58